MDIERVKETLNQTARRMLDLSKDLGQRGRDLDQFERDLIRTAMIPAVKERLDMLLLEYMTGGGANGILKDFYID